MIRYERGRVKCIYCGKRGQRICARCSKHDYYEDAMVGFTRLKLRNAEEEGGNPELILAHPRYTSRIPVAFSRRRPGTWTGDTQTVFIVCCNVHCRAILKTTFKYVTSMRSTGGSCVTCPECAVHHFTFLEDGDKAKKHKELEFA